MQIFTKVDKYTIDKIKKENKKRVEADIFPTGPIVVPVMFEDTQLIDNGFFTVVDGKIAMKNSDQKIDFGFKLYGKEDGPNVIPSMIHGFNHFIDNHREQRLSFDQSLFTCIDRILFDLGYVGKMVKAAGVEKDAKGDVSIYSFNYAESLITKEDWMYNEYMYIKESAS